MEAVVDNMTIAAVQIESEIGAPERNAAKMKSWIDKAAAAQAQLVFFPECSLTGYTMNHAGKVAISADNPQIKVIEERAHEHGIAVGYGLIERNAQSANLHATYVIASRESRLVYRKTHLGTRECEVLTGGNELPVASIGGIQVGVQLCWEAHLPDITATLRGKGAQLVIMPHAGGLGGARRLESWERYLPARALDNGLFVAACTAIRRGADGCVGGGGIVIYGPDGRLIAWDGSHDEVMVTATIGGKLPREGESTGMHALSYYDRRRPELYR